MHKHVAFSMFVLYIYMSKTAIPQNDIVLCSLVSKKEKETSTGFIYKSSDILLYRVEGIGPKVKMALKVGDIVVTSSKGTQVDIDGTECCLFKEDSIVGKVEE